MKTHLTSCPFAPGHGGVGAEGICPSVCHYYLSEPGREGHTWGGGGGALSSMHCSSAVLSWWSPGFCSKLILRVPRPVLLQPTHLKSFGAVCVLGSGMEALVGGGSLTAQE